MYHTPTPRWGCERSDLQREWMLATAIRCSPIAGGTPWFERVDLTYADSRAFQAVSTTVPVEAAEHTNAVMGMADSGSLRMNYRKAAAIWRSRSRRWSTGLRLSAKGGGPAEPVRAKSRLELCRANEIPRTKIPAHLQGVVSCDTNAELIQPPRRYW